MILWLVALLNGVCVCAHMLGGRGTQSGGGNNGRINIRVDAQ